MDSFVELCSKQLLILLVSGGEDTNIKRDFNIDMISMLHYKVKDKIVSFLSYLVLIQLGKYSLI